MEENLYEIKKFLVPVDGGVTLAQLYPKSVKCSTLPFPGY